MGLKISPIPIYSSHFHGFCLPIFELQRPYGFEDPSVLPLLDLVSGAQEAPAHDWALHPFFERLLREQRSPGQKVGIPLLVPINLLEMPETIPDLEDGMGSDCD